MISQGYIAANKET